MEVSRPDFMGLGLVSQRPRSQGLGLAQDYSIETTRRRQNVCRKIIPSETNMFFRRKTFDKKSIGSRSRISKVLVWEGVISVSNSQVSVSISDDEAETPSLGVNNDCCVPIKNNILLNLTTTKLYEK